MLDIIQLTAEYCFVLVKFQNIEWNWSGIVVNIYINWTGYLCIYMFSVYSVQSEKKSIGLMRNDFRNSFVFRLTSRMINSRMNSMEILYSGHENVASIFTYPFWLSVCVIQFIPYFEKPYWNRTQVGSSPWISDLNLTFVSWTVIWIQVDCQNTCWSVPRGNRGWLM